MNRKKIGIKYCGGCNPKYDRTAWVDKLQEGLNDKIEWVYGFDPEVDTYLVVCGCETACADIKSLSEKKLILATSESNHNDCLAEIRKSLQEK